MIGWEQKFLLQNESLVNPEYTYPVPLLCWNSSWLLEIKYFVDPFSRSMQSLPTQSCCLRYENWVKGELQSSICFALYNYSSVGAQNSSCLQISLLLRRKMVGTKAVGFIGQRTALRSCPMQGGKKFIWGKGRVLLWPLPSVGTRLWWFKKLNKICFSYVSSFSLFY